MLAPGADKLTPDELKDQTQLQGFLGAVSDFYKDLAKDRKLLTDRLKKTMVPWSNDHTLAFKRIKQKIQYLPC